METEPTTSEFPSRGKATVEQILSSKINLKGQDCESHSQGAKKESYIHLCKGI